MNRKTAIIVILLMLSGYAWAEHASAPSITPEHALKMLKEGNARFMEGRRTYTHQDMARLKETAGKGQFPFAVILSCSDSRVPVEHIFDAGVGDIFVVRVAGNSCSPAQAESLDYGAEHLRAPLIVVMGHTKCGAVKATVDNAGHTGKEPEILKRIEPAVTRVKEKCGDLKGQQFYDAVSVENVWLVIEEIFKKSHLARELTQEGRLSVVGALYDLDTGKVTFLGAHKDEKKLTEQK
ncbi:MAG: carbonic anhydrase [Candidatus Xenobiia bacterium LiM19]